MTTMRARRLFTALTALTALAILLAVPPVVLLAAVGNPLPVWAGLRNGHLDDSTVIRLLACLGWIAWAQFVAGTVVEAAAAAHGGRLPRRIAFGQGLSRTLITIVLTSLALGSFASQLTILDAGRAAAAPPPPAPAVTAAHRGSPATPDTAPAGTVSDYTVGSEPSVGPTLWSIAEHKLGNPLRWTDIWQLNRGRVMSDGMRFIDPDLIHDGWVLYLPTSASAATGQRVSSVHVDVVRAGDTLSAIARAEYGNPDLYPIIAAANEGRPEPDGRVFADPNRIWPGDTVSIPALPGATRPTGSTTSPRTTRRHPTVPTTPPHGTTANEKHTPLPPVPLTPAPEPPTTAPANPSPDDAATRTTAGPTPGSVTTANGTHADTSWLMATVAGGGALLAGVCLTGLARRRRQQWRHRQPGRTIASAATDQPRLARVEKTLRRAAADTGTVDVAWLDIALRNLAGTIATRGGEAPAPDVAAACLTGQRLELLLTAAGPEPPDLWRADATGTHWTLERDAFDQHPETTLGPLRGAQWAPYPTLVSVGYCDDGRHWLIDLERLGVLRLAGDRDRCRNLMRFVAAELSHNTWSDHLQVSAVGFGDELAGLNPERLSCADDPAGLLALLGAQLDGSIATSVSAGVDALAGRVHDVDADAFTPHIALLAGAEDAGLRDLIAGLADRPGRVPLAVVVCDVDEQPEPSRTRRSPEPGCQGLLGTDGVLTLGPPLNLTLTAHQLPADEAGDLAALLALADDRTDRPMAPGRGDQPWDQYADAAGAVRPDTERQILSSDGESAVRTRFARASEPNVDGLLGQQTNGDGSLLALPQTIYLNHGATTPTDLRMLAPTLTSAVRQQIRDTDPGLDRAMATWNDPSARVPKLRLLGPISLTGIDAPPARRSGLLIEIVAYLVSHPHGVTVEQLSADLWPHIPDAATKTTPRQSVSMTRQWLGVSSSTGRERLPRAVADAAGLKLYRVEDVLVDAELFRRLRIRASSRAADGITDLHAALDLVAGPPLSGRRPAGYSWLADTPLDHEYTAMIVDVAHVVATHELAVGNPRAAAAAAHTALDAGAVDDVALLDLVAACHAQDRHAEAEEYVRRILVNHDAEVEEDLPPRTYEVLRRHGWLPV